MKHAVIAAHPDPNSFTLSLARTWCEAAAAKGHDAQLRDLYAMGFDPLLKAFEIAGRKGFAPGEDVKAERAVLGDADVFVFVYPFWINTPPAILKGYIERVFGYGFAYGPNGDGNQPLLTGRKMLSFTASGAPTQWVHQSGAWDAECALFDEYLSTLSGLTRLDHVHFGGIVPGIRADVVERHFETVRASFAKYF
jgi:NAD(P)H dehydrogenase (quinone)